MVQKEKLWHSWIWFFFLQFFVLDSSKWRMSFLTNGLIWVTEAFKKKKKYWYLLALFGSRKSWLPLWAALGRSLATSGGRVRNNNLWQSVPNSLGFSTQQPRHSMWPGGGALASPQAAVPTLPAAWRGGHVKLGAACFLCTYMPSY